jgi:hypothetical protein
MKMVCDEVKLANAFASFSGKRRTLLNQLHLPVVNSECFLRPAANPRSLDSA